MPTVSEMSKELGVSLSTVRRAVAELGLEAEGHATRRGGRGALHLDEAGASAVADAIAKRAGARPDPAAGGGTSAAGYDVAVRVLEERVADLVADRAALRAELASERARTDRLAERLASAEAALDRVRSASAIDLLLFRSRVLPSLPERSGK